MACAAAPSRSDRTCTKMLAISPAAVPVSRVVNVR